MHRGLFSSALSSHWRREVLRTSLWFVPSLEVVAAIGLFIGTLAADRAAYRGDFALPGWVISGSADAARQILTTIAAAIITVVGVVFSIILVTLTLASTQFGPRMLRNFIRDRGTQVTLGTFVATFVYSVLVLVSIGTGSHGDFVPHIGVTVTLGLMVIDLGVLIYFIHHTAISIQLPQVIASIAADLAEAIRAAFPNGIDLYFDNVGGETLDAVLPQMKAFGRIPVCGMISNYNHQNEPYLLRNIWQVLVNRITMRGFLAYEAADMLHEAEDALADWVRKGQLIATENVTTGLEHTPEAFIRLMSGTTTGKTLVRLREDISTLESLKVGQPA